MAVRRRIAGPRFVTSATRFASALLFLGIVGVAAVPAAAQPSEAVQHFDAAQEHYSGGRYQEALTSLQAALAVDPNSPTLNFNAGRVSELLGQIPQALDYFRRAERLLPESETEERDRLNATIRRLEGAQQHVPAPQQQAPPPLREYRTEHGVADPVFFAAVAVSGVLLVSGLIVGNAALSKETEADEFVAAGPGDYERWQALVSEADNLALSADILLGAGVLAGVGAALLYSLRERKIVREVPQEQPWIITTRNGVVGGVRGRW